MKWREEVNPAEGDRIVVVRYQTCSVADLMVGEWADEGCLAVVRL